MRQLPLGVRLSDRARLSSYVAGSNVEALAALHALIGPDGAGTLWLWGPAGSGRSHLLQAACAAVNGAAYFPLEELAALGPDCLAGTAGLGLVAIDDVERVAADAAWERGLLFLYREIEAAGGRLLFASASAPRHAGFALPDLASRLAATTVHALQPLDDAGQREALRLRAAVRGLELPEETASYLQRRHPRDMPTLLALLEKLDVEALSAQRRLTIPFIRQALDPAADAAPSSPRGGPGPARG
jgi:DnaA-homolog protein